MSRGIDQRLELVCDAMDQAIKVFDLRAGENLYLLTVLLLGSINEAPADVRELFRGACVQAILEPKRNHGALEMLCLDGQFPEWAALKRRKDAE